MTSIVVRVLYCILCYFVRKTTILFLFLLIPYSLLCKTPGSHSEYIYIYGKKEYLDVLLLFYIHSRFICYRINSKGESRTQHRSNYSGCVHAIIHLLCIIFHFRNDKQHRKSVCFQMCSADIEVYTNLLTKHNREYFSLAVGGGEIVAFQTRLFRVASVPFKRRNFNNTCFYYYYYKKNN